MPAKSVEQQRFMGMVYAYKRGELKNASDAVKKAAESISLKDAKDFASTDYSEISEAKKSTRETDWMYGKAPKKGTVAYEIWKSKVDASKTPRKDLETEYHYGNTKVKVSRNESANDCAMTFKQFLLQEQSGE
jgi:hypothetical protein